MTTAVAFAARHSMDSPEWYTPVGIVDAARVVLGGRIDLDPASDADANTTVRATAFYTATDDGLVADWHGRVFLNPPGGLVIEFWRRLMDAWQRGALDAAIWIGYSLEQLQTLQRLRPRLPTPLDFPMCVPARRIAFVENAAKQAARVARLRASGKTPHVRSQPSHGNYITYLGPDVQTFARVFDPAIGQVTL